VLEGESVRRGMKDQGGPESRSSSMQNEYERVRHAESLDGGVVAGEVVFDF